MTINDLHIGQRINASYWYKDKDGFCECADIEGVVTKTLNCYNSIIVNIEKVFSGYDNRKSVQLNLDKTNIQIREII